MKNSKIIVAFQIGRGGPFHNAGHKSFLGEKNFQDLINLECNHLFEKNRDDQGRFCKPYLVSDSGNAVSEDDVSSFTGTLDFDGKYDTCYAISIEDCSEQEIELIAESDKSKSFELRNWLEAYDLDVWVNY